MGAALVLGNTLIGTGAAKWLIGLMIGASGLQSASGHMVVLAGLILVSLTSHAYFTSHTARVAALLPPLLLLANRSALRRRQSRSSGRLAWTIA